MGQDIKIFCAARVRTLDGTVGADPVDAFATSGDHVVATGRSSDLRARFPRAEHISLGDAVVVPGFNDAHQHPSMVASNALHLDVGPRVVPHHAALKILLSDEGRRVGPGRWIRASGYDDTKMSADGALNRRMLDEAVPDNPAIVMHVSAHKAVVNSAALQAGGLDDASAAPPGGELGRDATGRLDGSLRETALFRFAYSAIGGAQTVVPAPDMDERINALQMVTDALAASGITSVTDALAGPDDLMLYQEARDRGPLPQRVNLLLTWETFNTLEVADRVTGRGDHRLRVGGVKAILDGSVSAGSCLVSEPLGCDHGFGTQTLDRWELRRIVEAVHTAGCRLAVHANGDRAIELLLDELERIANLVPVAGLRHRIEHCSIVNSSILRRMATLKVIAVPFGGYIGFHTDKLLALYGPDRLEQMFAHRSFLDAGVTVAGSSDHPCGPFEPLLAMRDCVTREAPDGRVLGPSQRISAEQALRVYTIGSAVADGEDHHKGTLAPGHLADFVVLSEDPLTVDPHRISDIEVLETYVGADRIWSAADAIPRLGQAHVH
jgi:predicted amidohydrolase YtcJ